MYHGKFTWPVLDISEDKNSSHMSYECFAHFSSQKLSMIKKVLGQSL